MRLLSKTKDGGKDSFVDAYFLCEFKGLFSIALLKFNKGGRRVYHTHAFNAWTWFICGSMVEHTFPLGHKKYTRTPKYTPREKNHYVYAFKDSWALTVRGPWSKTWTETHGEKTITLGHGRKIL